MNSPLVPSPDRAKVWWDCPAQDPDHAVFSAVRPNRCKDHPGKRMAKRRAAS